MNKIAIHSVPRSGSTWLGEIFNSSPNTKYCFQPLFSYRFKDFLDNTSTRKSVNNFFELLSQNADDFVCQTTQRDEGSLPKFSKSSTITHTIYKEVRYHHLLKHLCELERELKFVFLIRDPIEVMNSWINAPKEFNPSWSVTEELFQAKKKNDGRPENFYGLDAWIATSKLFEWLANSCHDQVTLVKYSSLKQDPIAVTRELFSFCSLDYTESTDNFLRNSTTKKVKGTYSVFRGTDKSPLCINDDLIELIRSRVTEAGLDHYLTDTTL